MPAVSAWTGRSCSPSTLPSAGTCSGGPFPWRRGDTRRLEEIHLAGMDAFVGKAAPGSSYQLPRGWWLLAFPECVTLTRESSIPCPLPPLTGKHTLELPLSPGETVETGLPGWRVAATLISAPPADIEACQGSYVAFLDSEAVRGPILVRARRPGDRIQPTSMTGHRKLQDLFVDAKVPRHWRDRIPCWNAAGKSPGWWGTASPGGRKHLPCRNREPARSESSSSRNPGNSSPLHPPDPFARNFPGNKSKQGTGLLPLTASPAVYWGKADDIQR